MTYEEIEAKLKEVVRRRNRAMRKMSRPEEQVAWSEVQPLIYSGIIRCEWCRRPLYDTGATLDNPIPLTRGGKHHISNVVICCKRCNWFKYSMLPDEYVDLLRAIDSVGMLDFFFQLYRPAIRKVSMFEHLTRNRNQTFKP